LSEDGAGLRATLSVTLTVDEDNPSFYVSVYASSDVNDLGTADFFNTAKAGLKGPAGFTYTSKNGFASQVVIPPPSDGPVELNGRVQLDDGTNLCAMFLASGQFMFTCDPVGAYSLTDLPREPDGTVNRQVYVDGMFPSVDVLPDSVNQTVVMKPAVDCPTYNPPTNPGTNPGYGPASTYAIFRGRIYVCSRANCHQTGCLQTRRSPYTALSTGLLSGT
jgi:hypothetical protein